MMLRKELQQRTPSPSQILSLDSKSLMREGSRFEMIDDTEVWFEYRRVRNITHTYDEATAQNQPCCNRVTCIYTIVSNALSYFRR